MSSGAESPPPDSLLRLQVGPVAHGGHCVARHEGRVVFVRHSLPGEVVLARVVQRPAHGRFWRADAVQVLQLSPNRVLPPCPVAGECGGCDWQHAELATQRELKRTVVLEQLQRLGGLSEAELAELALSVEAVPGDRDGLGWRTREQLAVDGRGRAGLRAHRSHHVVPVEDCPIAHPDLALPDILSRDWAGASAVLVSVGTGESPSVRSVVVVRGERAAAEQELVSGPARVSHRVGNRLFRVSAAGFWQVHPGATTALLAAVLDGLQPRPGEHCLDLYSGVGVISASLADAVGPGGQVWAVEADARAVKDARRNLHDLPQVHLVHAKVLQALVRAPTGGAIAAPPSVELIVLDPPRRGAGAAVCAAIAERRPRAVAYVACDPAALARDVRTFAGLGYRVSELRAFDLFPMTHHVECVAILRHEAEAKLAVQD